MISAFTGTTASNDYNKFTSKLHCVLNRLEHIPEGTEERPALLSRVFDLLGRLQSRAEELERTMSVPVHLSLLADQTENLHIEDVPAHTSSPIASIRVPITS
uniref:Uncharacterized protein LOC114342046 n=1 Tax=Diabrotica virgifera virgifera TaxID=50390 RepID=A0A6P7GTG1_DIAVI